MNGNKPMNVTAELSMYPLREDFIPAIDAVIEKLNSYANIKVQTFATATTLIGDYEAVMNAIKETIAWSYSNYGTAVFSAKIIPGYVPAT
ncbi:MAG: hypothetical protein ACI915_001206 [Gammaproteobacteria bacterium]|jgi:uncharacterized protein YqgV (UPF0045/DUF77 family)